MNSSQCQAVNPGSTCNLSSGKCNCQEGYLWNSIKCIEGILTVRTSDNKLFEYPIVKVFPIFFMSMDNRVLRLLIFLHWEMKSLNLILKRYVHESN